MREIRQNLCRNASIFSFLSIINLNYEINLIVFIWCFSDEGLNQVITLKTTYFKHYLTNDYNDLIIKIPKNKYLKQYCLTTTISI